MRALVTICGWTAIRGIVLAGGLGWGRRTL